MPLDFSRAYKAKRKALLLVHQGLTSQDITATVAPFLQQHPEIATLNLCSNQIGSEGAMALAQVLGGNIGLTTLDLSANAIGSEGVRALAQVLQDNISLTRLDLSVNAIGSEGAKVLAQTLQENTSLTTLDLSCNHIGAEGIKALVQALQRGNTNLTTLKLNFNCIGVEGVKALASISNVNYLSVKDKWDSSMEEDESKKAITEENPIKKANYGREVGLITEVPSLLKMGLFQIQESLAQNLGVVTQEGIKEKLPLELQEALRLSGKKRRI